MYVSNNSRRLGIHVNSRLRAEMPDKSVFRLRSSVPIEEEYRVTAKEAYIHNI
ncbi:hypothetical protein [Aquiflexum balticum]|uniref:hypothetical protein n=1 Tax=Aquiflexum balticum TaxID=280473 RepID=UPI0012F9FE1B|nr:hypothetical protein [Aquiflexum balticum]